MLPVVPKDPVQSPPNLPWLEVIFTGRGFRDKGQVQLLPGRVQFF